MKQHYLPFSIIQPKEGEQQWQLRDLEPKDTHIATNHRYQNFIQLA
jgi:hypothetical protein